MAAAQKTLVIRNGTLIDGSGHAAARNDAIVIEGNRIKSVGALPTDVRLEDRSSVVCMKEGGVAFRRCVARRGIDRSLLPANL